MQTYKTLTIIRLIFTTYVHSLGVIENEHKLLTKIARGVCVCVCVFDFYKPTQIVTLVYYGGFWCVFLVTNSTTVVQNRICTGKDFTMPYYLWRIL